MAKSSKEKIQLNPDKLLGFKNTTEGAKVGTKVGGKLGNKVGGKGGSRFEGKRSSN